MDNREIIKRLFKVAQDQQKAIRKLAQVQALPLEDLKPQVQHQHQDATKAIVSALGPFYNKSLSGLSVDPTKNQVNVSFRPGQATQANYDHVMQTVQNLQNSNVLVGGPYKVSVA